MENKRELLDKLKKRNEELKAIVFVGFKTEKELLSYRKKIAKERDEYYENQEKIHQLEYELKTPEEKKEYDEYLRKLQLKSEGKPLI